jgi:xanthine dehydrogenase accessory factor
MENIYVQFLDHQSDNKREIITTVTATQGSTPQKPGSSALFSKNGLVAGTVGGGVVEARVEKLAISAVESKKSGYFTFDLNNDISSKEEAICGGRISILIDANAKNHLDVFRNLRESYNKRIPGILATMVTRFSEDTVLINRYWITGKDKPGIPPEFMSGIEPIVNEMLSNGNRTDYKSVELNIPGEEPSSVFFLESVLPRPRLIIAGTGHIGKVLAHLGEMLDFEVTIIDDRAEYANQNNIPWASHILVSDIGQALRELEKNDDTYVVIVTRGHKDDAEALKDCIGSSLAYTGMIGSKTKISSMRKDFIDNGYATIDQWSKIYAPVGLDIKSKTVEEIAVSIAAQLVLVRNSKK